MGTIIEAQERGQDRAVLVVHQLVPDDPAEDTRNWPAALASNGASIGAFVEDLQSARAVSHETEFVKPGTTLEVVTVQSVIG